MTFLLYMYDTGWYVHKPDVQNKWKDNTHTPTHTPTGEKPALLMCWKGTSLSTISRVFVPIIFVEQSVVVDVEGVGFRPRAVVAGRGVVVAVCTRISSKEYVYDK